MQISTYDALADYLKHGREIEFSFNSKWYSITNHSGFWYVYNDTDHVHLDDPCPFHDKNLLVSKVANIKIDGITISQIFDKQLYDTTQLHIL